MATLYQASRVIYRLIARVYLRWEVTGWENLPAEGPAVVVSNHQSTIDPLLVGSTFPHRPVRFMAKKELWKNPLVGRYISTVGAFPVDRKAAAGDRQAYAMAIHVLKNGEALMLFPEGTRSVDGSIGPFQEGAARIALSVPGTRIVPLRIRGTGDAFPRGASFPRPRKVRIAVGEAFTADDVAPPGTERKSLYRIVTEAMLARISSM